jgi:hypothetical protein
MVSILEIVWSLSVVDHHSLEELRIDLQWLHGLHFEGLLTLLEGRRPQMIAFASQFSAAVSSRLR